MKNRNFRPLSSNVADSERKVTCRICNGQMYYIDESSHIPEYFINIKESVTGISVDGFYVHQHCWNQQFPESENSARIPVE